MKGTVSIISVADYKSNALKIFAEARCINAKALQLWGFRVSTAGGRLKN